MINEPGAALQGLFLDPLDPLPTGQLLLTPPPPPPLPTNTRPRPSGQSPPGDTPDGMSKKGTCAQMQEQVSLNIHVHK